MFSLDMEESQSIEDQVPKYLERCLVEEAVNS